MILERRIRVASSGDISLVRKPSRFDAAGLSQYVLRDQPSWTVERIEDAMHAGREQAVPLKKPLPVHIGYWTAWVEPDGGVKFTDDPYGIDRAHSQVRHQIHRFHQTAETAN